MTFPDVETDGEEDFRIGLELEFPLSPREHVKFKQVGEPSDELIDTPDNYEFSHEVGEATYERIGGMEYGYELRTPNGGLHYKDIVDWYTTAIREFEEICGREFEPTGLFGDTTAGLHIHLSPIDEETARELYDMSLQPELSIFACSSIARYKNANEVNLYPVNRSGQPDSEGISGYCDFNVFNRGHDSMVHSRNSRRGHWVWRLPEPMLPENFELVVEFLSKFMVDREEGERFVKEKVEEGSDSLTSVVRARECEIHEVDEVQYANDATELLEERVAPEASRASA